MGLSTTPVTELIMGRLPAERARRGLRAQRRLPPGRRRGGRRGAGEPAAAGSCVGVPDADNLARRPGRARPRGFLPGYRWVMVVERRRAVLVGVVARRGG